jgi:hypothetical protein
MRADEGTAEDWEALRIWPGERYPELPFFDDDWGRYYYKDDPNDTVAYEIHEMCNRARCSFRAEVCNFHPIDCECSEGACQEDERTPLITHQLNNAWLRRLAERD